MPGPAAAAATMLRRQFRFPLSLGTDICNIPRIRRILDGPQRDRFIRRVLLPEERGRVYNYLNTTTPGQAPSQAAAKGSDVELGRRKAAEFMAGRFAAKEAVIKAHPHLRISFEDITIVSRQPDHHPRGVGDAAVVNASGGGPPVALIRHAEDGREVVQEALLSISHDADYSTAVCMGMTAGGWIGGEN
ncbi:hypothetical protein PpBr36_00973 [Pyricularia pennisetigena]|uniref:hypothetical protein n=1 Tax=Pyricularia pennisetigena TaxID=1578925 RepID=UPI001151536C|nr:hypothetical protein PpBr36_00973 [Pyricularia pennisetigena]TLS28343.1 hypothetical protein PpBr36_00973 [Pyricularia pennisetigena]